MTYLDDDTSAQDSSPRFLYVITQSPLIVYRVTSGERDVTYDGHLYKALQLQANEVGPATSTGESVLELTLPLSHPLCQRFMAFGVPPQKITVDAFRLQLRSGEAKRFWFGTISQMDVPSSNTAKFSIPSRFQKSMKRRLPLITVSRMCPHILYDRNCQIDRSLHTYTTTIARVDGRVLNLVTIGPFGDNNLALYGEIVHLGSQERSTVIEQESIGVDGTTKFTMQVPIPEMKQGDTVQVVAGCFKDQATCINKYANFANFGGFPDLPPAQVSSPTGPGVYYYEVQQL